jgi:hypothetical protein
LFPPVLGIRILCFSSCLQKFPPANSREECRGA